MNKELYYIKNKKHFIGFEPMTCSLEGYCSNPTELKMQIDPL